MSQIYHEDYYQHYQQGFEHFTTQYDQSNGMPMMPAMPTMPMMPMMGMPMMPMMGMPMMPMMQTPVLFPGHAYPGYPQWGQQCDLTMMGYYGNYGEGSATQNWQVEGDAPTEEPPTLKRILEADESWEENKKMKLSEEAPMSRFERQHCCGKGTFGQVFRAKELSTGRTVALKQIKLNGKEGFPRTAIREIIIMKKHKHQNILSIEEVVWAEDGDVFLVMDFYDYDLRRLLEKHHLKFNGSEVKFLFRQLALGVAYLHDNVLMHRDLKTENILINARGELKICDFGLARTFFTEKTYTPVVITLWYRPPELLLGPCAYSCEVDQWSVGCIFAELIRSAVLFTGSTEIDQVDRIFSIIGTPNTTTWPEYEELPGALKNSFRNYPNRLRTVFPYDVLSSTGFDLLKAPEPVSSIPIDLMVERNKS